MSVYQRKLVIVGDGAVGKTCLLIRFTMDKFPGSEDYIPTVFDNYAMDVHADQQTVQLGLWDTAGQESYDRLRPLSYAGSHVILIAFSISCPESLENVQARWVDEVHHYAPGVPFILVGCKEDLREDEETLERLAWRRQRPITFNEGLDVALKMGAGQYFECSAKTGEGVAEIFEVAARAAIEPPSRTSHRHNTRGSCIVF
ncbi:small GTPase-binding protein [Flagelloscypha sp. PMI_526]|nr:small GTPase-binding protein [Flagelloscypha sp. PMI_526]